MAYREVFGMEIQEMIRRWQAGAGRRQIAAGTGLSRTMRILTRDQFGRLGLSHHCSLV